MVNPSKLVLPVFRGLPGRLLVGALTWAAISSLASPPANATSYLPISDSDLLAQTPLVVRARVVSIDPAPFGSGVATDYAIEVDRVLKGFAPGTTLILRVPGGSSEGRRHLELHGAPKFDLGEVATLFLSPRADGSFAVRQWALGAFRHVRIGDRTYALRDLSDMSSVSGAPQDAGVARLAGRFENWLENRALGAPGAVDYLVSAGPVLEAHRFSGEAGSGAEFSFIGGQRHRWLEFERGAPVRWYRHEAGQPDLAGGGEEAFVGALAAWNADADTNINYQFAGTTSADIGFTDFDGVNAILFEDPHDEAEGDFICSFPGNGSGVLAIGGPWWDEDDPEVILGADIVVNKGTSCYINGDMKRAEQIYGHELGHTLGLGHSCGDSRTPVCSGNPGLDDALMRANVHRDDRGATLADDDRAGIRELYLGADVVRETPLPPFNLRTTALAKTSLTLAWDDAADNETNFVVEMRLGAKPFAVRATLKKNKLVLKVAGLKANTVYDFRVRAKNAKGFSEYSNVLTVRTPR
jgi:hypothetical protein